MENNVTADQTRAVTGCPIGTAREERWWVWLVTSTIIYFVGLSLSALAYLAYRTSRRQTQTTAHDATVHKPAKLNFRYYASPRHWRELAQTIITGNTIPAKILITFIVCCNITYMILVIYHSYQFIEECFSLSDSPSRIVELVVSMFLILFALLRFCTASTVLHYWISLYTIVDAYTLPHIFVALALGQDWLGLRALRFVWLTQIVEIIRYTRLIRSQDIIDLISLLVKFLVLWLIGAGIIYFLEAQGDPWLEIRNGNNDTTFLDYTYFIMVTISTVGYGDISPKTALGKAYMTFFIIVGLAFFAAILPALAITVSQFYSQSLYSKFQTTRVYRHIIVCGHITAASVEDFLDDFLHGDRGDKHTHVLFLHPESPDQKLKTLLNKNYTRVQYIRGSVLISEDLLRAKINRSMCRACFILANKHCDNPIEEDNANLLRFVSIKNTNQNIPIVIQLLRSVGKEQVTDIEGWNHGRDIAICLSEFQLGILGQSCSCPGFSTVISNLFYPSNFPPKLVKNIAWLKDYAIGASNEIYCSSFSHTFYDKTFCEAVNICYHLGLVLIAIEDKGKLYVAPCSKKYHGFIIHSEMRGYCIGQDQNHVDTISVYCSKCHKIDPLPRRRCQCKSSSSEIEMKAVKSIDDSSADGRQPLHPVATTMISMDDQQPLHHMDEAARKKSIYECQPQTFAPLSLTSMVTDTAGSVLQDHIVLCLFANKDSPPLGLQHFLRPLRSSAIPRELLQPVVIISDKDFLETKEWSNISSFPNIYVVPGSPLQLETLKQANVGSCSVCVILSALATSSTQEEAMNDKEVVLCSLRIHKHFNYSVRILTDIRHEANVQFLDLNDEDYPSRRIYSALPFASGEAFSISMLDSVTISAFYTPGIVNLLEDIINGSHTARSRCLFSVIPLNSIQPTPAIFEELYEAQLRENSICLAIGRLLDPKYDAGTSHYHILNLSYDAGTSDDPKYISTTVSKGQRFVITTPNPQMPLQPDDVAIVMREEPETS